MPEAEAKDPMVELDVSGDSVDVELKEKETKKDTPEVTVKEEQPEEKTEEKDEREEYSEGVKKRIDRMTYKIREAERREKDIRWRPTSVRSA